MDYRNHVQVLVIGGGPAGSVASRTLAQHGIDTILIERNLAFRKPCGGGIPSPAFEELLLPEETIKKRVDRMRIVSPTGNILDIPLKGGFIAIVDRQEFDSVLRQEAKRAGVKIIEGEFIGFKDTGRQVTSEVIIAGERVSIRSDYVIASDGVNSRTRISAGLGPIPSFMTVSEKIDGNTDFCEFWLGSDHAPHLYSWVFPSVNGLSVGTGVIGGGNVNVIMNRFLQKRQLKNNNRIRGYKIPLWKGDTFNKGNILFAGDAAGQVMPLSFEGIYYAMKSGQLAAKAVINHRPGDYRKLWRDKFYKRFLLMRLLWEYFLKSDERAEKLVELLKRPELQEASMRLWLSKDMSQKSLLSYIKHFKSFIVKS
ncbi:MAG: geranylgeranyl reductase family protein [Thermodesulfovibrionales bacterium]